MKILTMNCGSSSIKFKIFSMPEGTVIAKGQADRIGLDDSRIQWEGKGITPCIVRQELSSHKKALEMLLGLNPAGNEKSPVNICDITAVGHRFVHGGEFFRSSVAVNPSVRRTLEVCRNLAPLHNPHNLTGIDVCTALIPEVPQIAVFDTAFHQSMPDYAYTYAIPFRYYEENRIRKYGFHGTSHRYVAERAAEIIGKDIKNLRIITAHLGNGSSLCAIGNGKSCDTSMGFTPLSGIVMGTRCGDIDPALIAYLIDDLNIPVHEAMRILNHESGVLGISGLSSDFRDLFSAAGNGHERAALALNVFAYSTAKGIGSLIPAINGLDVLVFTAGIGENSPRMRQMICDYLSWLGISLDHEKNVSGILENDISLGGSPVSVLVIPTDEEKIIAVETMNILKNSGQPELEESPEESFLK
ncbi:MAG TPA: acetate kinase [Desulfomonilia bacterium]